jgi:hypothetical protein
MRQIKKILKKVQEIFGESAFYKSDASTYYLNES